MAGLPKGTERLVQPNGTPTTTWYRIFQSFSQLVSISEVRAFFKALLQKLGSPDGTLENLPPIAVGSYLPTSTRVEGEYSVDYSGTLDSGLVRLSLVNDEFEPGPTRYYGTSSTGVLGYQAVFDAFLPGPGITLELDTSDPPTGVTTVSITPVEQAVSGALLAVELNELGQVVGNRPATITGTDGRIEVANGNAVAGLPTIDLAEVSNAGGGNLQKTAFDSYGRATGYSAATTDDLNEGSVNLYFTNARVAGALQSGDTPDYLQIYIDERDAT